MQQLIKLTNSLKCSPTDKLIGYKEIQDESKWVNSYSFITTDNSIYDVLCDQDGGSKIIELKVKSCVNRDLMSIEPTHKIGQDYLKQVLNNAGSYNYEYLTGKHKGKQTSQSTKIKKVSF